MNSQSIATGAHPEKILHDLPATPEQSLDMPGAQQQQHRIFPWSSKSSFSQWLPDGYSWWFTILAGFWKGAIWSWEDLQSLQNRGSFSENRSGAPRFRSTHLGKKTAATMDSESISTSRVSNPRHSHDLMDEVCIAFCLFFCFFHGNLRYPPQCHVSPPRNKALLREING